MSSRFSAFLPERIRQVGRMWRSQRARRPRRRRGILGEDSWMEITHKVVTIFALAVGVWAYFFSVRPVQHAERLQRRIDQLEEERPKLIQRLERVQSFFGKNRKGIVLSYLAEIRNRIEQDARAYQGMAPVKDGAPVGFDLRNYSLAWAATQLERLGQPQAGSAEAYEKDALDFFQAFVEGRVPPGTADVRWLSPLLDEYDRESRAAGGARAP